MSGGDATRFFDTSGCLNLTRPTTGTSALPLNQRRNERKRPTSSSIQIRGQLKIDLYNFDHIDFIDSKYVLTSPRSLEACARLNIKPVTLLPKRLADVQDDIGSEKVRLSTLADVRDKMDVERLGNLQRCREEREKIIREETLANPPSTKVIEPQPSAVHDRSLPRRTFFDTKFNPSNSLLHGLDQPTTINSVPVRSQSATGVKFSEYNTNTHLPPRPTSSNRTTVANSILKSASSQWPPTSLYDDADNRDDSYEQRASSSAHLHDDVQRLNKNLRLMSTSDSMPKQNKNERYVSGLENVKQMIERRVAHSNAANDPDAAGFERKQYEVLLGHYDHELKIQKARENALRSEKEKELERHETLLHDFLDQTKADERRENEIRRKITKLHHTRQFYGTLQQKNHEEQLTDLQRQRLELLHKIKSKDRRTKHFIKDKEETTNLSRSLAKSSQDLRDYLRETNQSFDVMAKKAELTNSVLDKKTTKPLNRNHFKSSLRT
ncbi:unnamed protein product [Rotaria magnacalcarata]|uniref:Uncharacterized protein n=4 Tax=Rotaria magnacalcarata TaxID=392030 RepID=A0A816Z903_9BILA|nr:unnamed protein product [Rotaria magnacalcarata]CAF1456615.1 unnamed protein product [Rotaria magnacalcarata]CAF2062428.1 unnamed protein product [Rotaria magnacalcarata]CAF2182548.1 unnamed protein product [Rotaria magnacalcarata]CAF2183048.1 unnamed protein product [Rotaria magnacalcarata]